MYGHRSVPIWKSVGRLLKVEPKWDGLKNLKPQHLRLAERAYSCLFFLFVFIPKKFSVKPTNKPVTINGRRDRLQTLLDSSFICTRQNPTQPPVVDFREQKGSENASRMVVWDLSN